MSINMTQLVNPSDYDEQLYDLTHNVLDRTIELASLVDQVDDEVPGESEDAEILETLRSQAAFTPSERNELSLTQQPPVCPDQHLHRPPSRPLPSQPPR